ncbi:MMPL family transporter [Gammaproteobacteria bacterium]|nr:MMPL family transporter [Gammaproteobacteria bacterium]
MNNIFKTILLRPWLTLSIIALVLLVSSPGLNNFKLDASSDALVIEGDEAFKIYRETGEIFGNSDFLIVTFTPNADLFSAESLGTIRALEVDLERLVGVDSVLSILDAPIFFQPKVPLSDLMDNLKTLDTPGLNMEAAKDEILNNPVYSELIISASGSTTAMQITLSENPIYRQLISRRYELNDSSQISRDTREELKKINEQISSINEQESTQRAELISQIRELLVSKQSSGTLFLGGASMIANDMMSFIKSDLAVFGLGVALVFCLMLYLFFQNLWFVFLPLFNALITTVFTASILGLMDWKISVISSNFIALLLILTISLTVHVLVRFTELSKVAHTTDDAIYLSLNQMVMPCLFAALTTAIAFLSLIMGDIKPVIEFGKMMSVGMVFAFILTFTFLPAAMKLVIKSNNTHSSTWINNIPDKLAKLTLIRGSYIAIFFALASMTMIYGVSKLEVENRFIDYFSPETEIYQGMLLLDQELGGTATLEILIDQPQQAADDELLFADDDLFEDDLFEDDSSAASGYWWNASSLSRLEEIHDYLDDIPEMGKVLSVASGIKLARMINDDQDLNDLELALLRSVLPDDIKETLLSSYINEDDSRVRISARVLESAETLNRKELLQKINFDLVNEFNLEPEQFKITGLAVLYNNMLQSLFSSQIKSLGLVFGAIGLMLLLLFRSLKITLIALAPNLITAGSVLGMLGILGIPLDMMTITVAAISVGMAVDNTIHYLIRYRTEVQMNNASLDDRVLNSHHSVGQAVFYTATTIAAGFMIFAFSNFTPTVLFGVFTAFALLVSFFASLTLLPYLLNFFNAFQTRQA